MIKKILCGLFKGHAPEIARMERKGLGFKTSWPIVICKKCDKQLVNVDMDAIKEILEKK